MLERAVLWESAIILRSSARSDCCFELGLGGLEVKLDEVEEASDLEDLSSSNSASSSSSDSMSAALTDPSFVDPTAPSSSVLSSIASAASEPFPSERLEEKLSNSSSIPFLKAPAL